jgi:hypothetical protein
MTLLSMTGGCAGAGWTCSGNPCTQTTVWRTTPETTAVALRLIQQTASAITIGFTATSSTPTGHFDFSCQCPGWTCPINTYACTRSDVLNAGASYPAITVTVSVGASAGSPLVNSVSASGGGSATAGATDSTIVQAAGTAVRTVSVTPGSGLGAQQTFALVYADPLGATDLTSVWVWITSNFNPAAPSNSCLIEYARTANLLYLYNDAGTGWLPAATLGAAGTLSNSSCSMNTAAATVTASGTNLTVNLPMAFTAAYAGAKSVYMYAGGRARPADGRRWEAGMCLRLRG